MATPSGEADSLEPLQPEGKSMWGWASVIVNRLLALVIILQTCLCGSGRAVTLRRCNSSLARA